MKAELISTIVGAAACAAAGAAKGASIGIAVGGPIGAIGGTIPCAIAGGVIGALGGNNVGHRIDERSMIVILKQAKKGRCSTQYMSSSGFFFTEIKIIQID